jgi:hypothetical protein
MLSLILILESILKSAARLMVAALYTHFNTMKIADKETPYTTYGTDGSIHWYNSEGILIMSVTGEKRMKHKHADLIHAWADGAEIQMKAGDGWVDVSPSFNAKEEYHIKPEEKKPVVRWLWARKNEYGQLVLLNLFATEQEASMNKIPLVKLEWSRTEFPE